MREENEGLKFGFFIKLKLDFLWISEKFFLRINVEDVLKLKFDMLKYKEKFFKKFEKYKMFIIWRFINSKVYLKRYNFWYNVIEVFIIL